MHVALAVEQSSDSAGLALFNDGKIVGQRAWMAMSFVAMGFSFTCAPCSRKPIDQPGYWAIRR
jgi:hypothetical protein